MKAATISELKKELNTLPPKQVMDLCLRMAKYKKENKELLTYLLFEAGDEQQYIKGIEEEADQLFADVNKHNTYQAKKSLRKILKIINRYIKYSGNKQTEAELLIYYCRGLKNSGVRIHRDLALSNLYDRQLAKINKAIATLHEDLQYDYLRELENL